jgi:hypothetical protein
LKPNAETSAIIDQEDTTWGSTYLMIDRLLELKKHIMEVGDMGTSVQLELTVHQWEQAEELRDLLQEAVTVTIRLRLEDVTPGHFFREWTGLKLYLENKGGVLADDICASMKRREQEMLDNGMLLAAVLLDPDHADLLTENQKLSAQEKVVEVALKIKKLQPDAEEEGPGSKTELNSSSSADETDSDEDMRRVRRIYKEKMRKGNLEGGVKTELFQPSSPAAPPPSKKKKVEESVGRELQKSKILESLSTLTKNKSVLRSYDVPIWELVNEKEYPQELKDTALLLATMPPTQVSLQRLFSSLKFLKTNHKKRLGKSILNDMMFLGANMYQ